MRMSSRLCSVASSRRGPSATPSSCVRMPSTCAARRRIASMAVPVPESSSNRRPRSTSLIGVTRIERVDVHAIRHVGGDAPGGRVRMEEKALLLEIAHGVANRRGRHAQPESARDHARSSGLSSLDVRLDHRFQNPAFTFVELMRHKCKSTNDFQRGSSLRRGRPGAASRVA